jgi:hypothetical protein
MIASVTIIWADELQIDHLANGAARLLTGIDSSNPVRGIWGQLERKFGRGPGI